MSKPNEHYTLTLINQILSSVNRNRQQLEEQGGLPSILAEIHKITESWKGSEETSPASSKIMYALNPQTSRWAAVHIDENEAKTWQMFDYTPEFAKQWLEAGLTLSQAIKWAGFRGITDHDPKDIAEWENGFTGVEPYEVSRWLNSKIPNERALTWVKSGGNYYDGANWLSAFAKVDAESLYKTYRTGMTMAQLKPWVEKEIYGEEIKTLIGKGYTPAAAKKVLMGGHTPESAPDKRGVEPVPGRSWLRVAALIKNKSDIHCKFEEHGPFVNCELKRDNKPEQFTIRFRNSGHYVEAYMRPSDSNRYYYRGKIRNLSTLLENIEKWAS